MFLYVGFASLLQNGIEHDVLSLLVKLRSQLLPAILGNAMFSVIDYVFLKVTTEAFYNRSFCFFPGTESRLRDGIGVCVR